MPPCALIRNLLFLRSVLAYYDPARKTHAAGQGCSTNGSNHREYPTDTVLPPLEAHPFNVSRWVVQYVSALTAQPTDIVMLRKLKAASDSARPAGGFSLPNSLDQNWFDFMQVKFKMLDALENRMKADELWRPGCSLIDVGGGHGMLAAYLMARHDMHVKVFDVPSSYQCKEILSSPLKVHFFDGQSLPVADSAADAVSFMSVLHHAANSTETLLREAARVSRRWILVLEDTQTPAVAKRNQQHDPRGVFRTDTEWKQLFKLVPNFHLVRDGYVGNPVLTGRKGFVFGVNGDEPRCFSKWYVLESRRQGQGHVRKPAAARYFPAVRTTNYVNRTCVPILAPH